MVTKSLSAKSLKSDTPSVQRRVSAQKNVPLAGVRDTLQMGTPEIGALPPTMGHLIDQMSTLRDARRDLAKQDEALKQAYTALEETLLTTLDTAGCKKATGTLSSASISEATVLTIADWDAFTTYLIKSKQPHLVQRRVSQAAAIEIFQMKGKVPGLEPFFKRGIALRNL